jgi:DNA gyrase subunit A
MTVPREKVLPVNIEETMKESYLRYSMSVIVGRALPDVRDGLKPVHRRILHAMNDLGLLPNRKFVKSAKVCGDTSGNYHPHGEQVIYPTLVRLAQDFSLRYPLVIGQGNFGSIDGDPPAAMRYTEVKMSPFAVELLADIDKETVDFVPNYDGTKKEPVVFPSRFPQLLCNGSSGIAVGMATNRPPHNLNEIADALVSLVDDPELPDERLLKIVSGPDFPTGALIMGRSGIREAYLTGRGRIVVRARANVETQKSGKESIIVTEIPYEVNKAQLVETIAGLVRERKLEGIADLRDESDRDGIRVVIDLKREAQKEIVLNQLYKHTQMQTTFGVIMLALVNGRPLVLNLRQMLKEYISYREQVIVRRTKFELAEAEKRAHILEGLKIALDHLDEVIALIRRSKTTETARKALMERFKLSEIQAQAILDMPLKRLTSLERKKIEDEYLELIKLIARLRSILESRAKVLALIRGELLKLKEEHGDERRTEILEQEEQEFQIEDLIAEEDMVVTISHQGYIKRMAVGIYRRQERGGKGVSGLEVKEEDFVEGLFVASTHHYILFFTTRGRCHWLKVFEIPEGGRAARGKSIVNLLALASGERITAYAPVRTFDNTHYLFMITRQGVVKKTPLSDFSHPRRDGIIAATVADGDSLIDVKLTDGNQDLVIATRKGLAIRFPESEVRPMGRSAAGVRGIRLTPKDEVVGAVATRGEASLLVVTENGYGKRSALSDYRVTRRGGKGILTVRTTERNGLMVAIREVIESDELMLISGRGQVIRVPVQSIKIIGRTTQGVRLIRLQEGDRVVDVARVVGKKEEQQ